MVQKLTGIDSALEALKRLGKQSGMTSPMKGQIHTLQLELRFLKMFSLCLKNCVEAGKDVVLSSVVEAVFKEAEQGLSEIKVEDLDPVACDSLEQLEHLKLEIREICAVLFNCSFKSKSCTNDEILEIMDSLLRNLKDLVDSKVDVTAPVKNQIKVLEEKLRILIDLVDFFAKSCIEHQKLEDFLDYMQGWVNKAASLSLLYWQVAEDETMVALLETMISDLIRMIWPYTPEVTGMYVGVLKASKPSASHKLRTGEIVASFVDFLLEDLVVSLKDHICIPFAKQKVAIVQDELVSLIPFLKDLIDLQHEHEDLKYIYKRIITVAYQAEHVIESCSVIDSPIWYNMICLSDIIEEIKLIKIEVNKTKDQPTSNTTIFGAEMNFSGNLPAQDITSTMDEVVVGFKDEAKTIIDRLTRGSTKRDIISIVGMPGQGKTTLAKKVYNDPSVKFYFNKCAWCCVSQVYKARELLLDILTDLTCDNARASNCDRSDNELSEQLWKCLKERRYLIVMDDIWDVGAGENIKWSLPEDHNGSRILFTSRIHDLVSQDQPICNPHPLHLFSEQESWNLLQVKLFDKNGCPKDLSVVGKKIAKNCKGLPIAIVLVAGILARNKSSLNWWKQIESSTASHIASEGCLDILELTYKHLPDCLKPCFLYFGAFPVDRIIRIPKLIKLWIAESFIQTTAVRSLYDVAEEILRDLISRSLIIVAERSSSGGIKACCIHDLVRELCLSKVKEETFLQLVYGRDVAYYSNPKKYDQYRLCLAVDGVDSWSQVL